MDKTVPFQGFDRDVLSSPTGESQEDLRKIITAIARASHDITDLVSLGRLVPGDAGGRKRSPDARQILIDHLAQSRVKALSCAGDRQATELDPDGIYLVTIDPLEGMPEPDANLPFGTIFSISKAADSPSAKPAAKQMCAAGFIHYGPQTNLVFALGDGVHIFTLDRGARTYLLSAENVRIPDDTHEWAIDVTKRGRWPSSIRTLIDEQLGEADAAGAEKASVRWTGSLTADAYRILRRGGIYLCPMDDQPGREASCPDIRHAALPVSFVIERAGGRVTTGHGRLAEHAATDPAERTPMIFGSPGIVERVERLHALPESSFETSPLFGKRGLFHL